MTFPSNHKVAVVIPAFNEGNTIRGVIQGVRPYVSEVIVVDDCSTDKTSKEAEESGVVVVRHENNQGYDSSLNDGFREAISRGADIIFTFDADGEHDPKDIPQIIEPIVSGRADIVLGQRPATMHFAEKLFAFYTSFQYGIKDPLCGFKAYSRVVYEAVGYFDSVGSIGTELVLRGVSRGFKLVLVPIGLHTRVNDSSRFYRQRFRANVKILRAMFYAFFYK